jgi:DNA-binding response OmpR family regulator
VRATVSALLRGTGPTNLPAIAPTAPGVLTLAGMTVDLGTFEARDNGELIPLTPTEFRILAHLASTPDMVCSATDVMSAIHDYSYTSTEAQQSVKVYIRRIRRKIEACEHPSVEIVNSRTFGYRLQAASGAAFAVAA